MIILATLGIAKLLIDAPARPNLVLNFISSPLQSYTYNSLVNYKPVQSSGYYRTEDQISIAGVVHKFSYVGEGDVRITYEIPKGFKSFIFDIGIPDGSNLTECSNAYFSMTLDGDEIELPKEMTEPKYGNKAIHIELDIQGKSSMRLRLGHLAAIGFPRFTTKVADKFPMMTSKLVPALRQPEEKAKVSGSSVKLVWDSVDGAISYGINILSFKSDQDQSDDLPRVWATTVTGTSYKFDISNLPNGQYVWSVIAFGPKKALGAFSKDRSFFIDK